MSRRRVYSDNTIAIMQRFFLAFEKCRERKLLGKVKDYCKDNGIDKAHFYTQRKDLNRGFFEVGWIVPLIEKCRVSSYWLLTGQGEMFG